MIICKWCTNGNVNMTLELKDEKYLLDGKEIEKKIAVKLYTLNYEYAINLLKENGYG